MSERELLEHYKRQRIKAQNYLQRYVDELKFHFGLSDSHIIKILDAQIKSLRMKNNSKKWYSIFTKKFKI